MSNSWTCQRCGCTTNHFSSAAGCLVCDGCRTEVRSDADRNADIEFQRKMLLAKQHLSVGNWDEAKRLVKPYAASRPSEKQVYLYLLVATTKCFEDYLLSDPAARSEASEYWDKLKRLGCINSAMANYAERRAEEIKKIRDDYIATRTMATIGNSFLSFLTLCLIVCGEGVSIIFLILAVYGWVKEYQWLKSHNVDDVL